jgi:hypothetical protein
MGTLDLVIAVPILAGAGWLLFRSFRRAGGPCHGCSGGGCTSRTAASDALVKLGGGPPR